MLVPAAIVTVLAILHHADHVIRGELVLAHGLDPSWNHSGWPFQDPVTPFTASLAVYLLLVPGIVFTLRGRLWAGYWLVSALVLGAVIVVVHFVPGSETETPSVIYQTHRSATAGVLALVDVFAILASLIALAVQAVRVRRASGRWAAG